MIFKQIIPLYFCHALWTNGNAAFGHVGLIFNFYFSDNIKLIMIVLSKCIAINEYVLHILIKIYQKGSSLK